MRQRQSGACEGDEMLQLEECESDTGAAFLLIAPFLLLPVLFALLVALQQASDDGLCAR